MLSFVKMEGIGNDYIYMNGISQNIPLNKKFIQRISDRHFGIGSDGLVVILKSDCADFKMRIFNADGSEAKMCGNGIRCLAKFCYDQKLTDKTQLNIETLSGVKEVSLWLQDKHVMGASVWMGPATFPFGLTFQTVVIQKHRYDYTLVSMGNPHAVVLVSDFNFDVAYVGKKISQDSLVNGGVNVEFVRVIDRQHIQIRVYERGSQETLACGTGACAAVACLHKLGMVETEVEVQLAGGSLLIVYSAQNILMKGAARTVYQGMIKEDLYE